METIRLALIGNIGATPEAANGSKFVETSILSMLTFDLYFKADVLPIPCLADIMLLDRIAAEPLLEFGYATRHLMLQDQAVSIACFSRVQWYQDFLKMMEQPPGDMIMLHTSELVSARGVPQSGQCLIHKAYGKGQHLVVDVAADLFDLARPYAAYGDRPLIEAVVTHQYRSTSPDKPNLTASFTHRDRKLIFGE